MKRFFTSIAIVLLGVTFATATETTTSTKDLENFKRYRNAEPVMFVERGIEFMIFPDGTFDFNTNYQNTTSEDMYYRRSSSKRGTINTTYGAPGTRVKYSTSRVRPRSGTIIKHDYNGRVRRIGNIFINYNRQGQVKRIGSVYMDYKRRNGILRQVGGLSVQYNHWGEIVNTFGYVNFNNRETCHINNIDNIWHNDDSWQGDTVYDNDQYYYRSAQKPKTKSKRNN